MAFEISTTEILLVSNALLLAIALLMIVRFRRDVRAFMSFWHSPVGSSLADVGDTESDALPGAPESGDRRRLADTTTRLEQQLLLLRRDMHRQSASGSGPESAAPGQPPLPIENAVRMARHGAGVEDLTRSCGLSLGEARLMLKLHGKPTRTH